MFNLRGNAHIAIWENGWSGSLFGLRRDGQFQSGTARFARAGAQRPVSYCDEKSGPWPAGRVFIGG